MYQMFSVTVIIQGDLQAIGIMASPPSTVKTETLGTSTGYLARHPASWTLAKAAS